MSSDLERVIAFYRRRKHWYSLLLLPLETRLAFVQPLADDNREKKSCQKTE